MIKNPDAPATNKQLSYLRRLTNMDYADSNLTVEEASEIISKVSTPEGLLRFELDNTKNYVVDDSRQPFTEPKNTLITGEQRSGKTMTAVAKIVDRYQHRAIAIYLEKEGMTDFIVQGYDNRNRTAKIFVKGKIKIIKIPESYKLVSDIKIFANFHLFGIKAVYCPSYNFIASALKTDFISDGILAMDEYYIGDFNREGMNRVARELAKRSNQYAKKMLEVIVITPLANQLGWKARLDPTEHIETEFDKKTKIITCRVKKKGVQGTKIVTYDSMRYRRYYWTNETVNK